MKLKKILIVATSSLLLSACGGMGAGTLPAGGHPATAASTAEAIGRAYDSMLDLDSFEANFNLKRAHVDAKIAITESEESGYGIVNADASVKTKFAATGLTSTSLDDLAAEVKVDDLKLDVYVGTEFGEESEAMFDFNFSDIDFAAYVGEGNLYVNASDPELREFIPEIISTISALISSEPVGGNIMDSIPETFQVPGLIPEEALPIFDSLLGLVGAELPTHEDLMTMLGEVINEPVFAILDDYITVLDYDDGSFGIGIDLSEEDILSLAKIIISSINEEASGQEVEAIVAEVGKILDVGALKVTILLNEDALLTDFLVDIDVSIDTSLSEMTIGESGEGVEFNVALKSDLRMKYGDDVSVVLPTDLSSYPVMNPIN